MLRVFFGVIALVLSVAGARASDAERRFEQVFPAPTESVVLNVARGLVEVESAPAGSQVEFEVVLRAQHSERGDEDAAARSARVQAMARDVQRAMSRLEPRFRADARRVELNVRDTREVVLDWDPALQMTILVRVRVPEDAKLVLRTVAAGLTMGDFGGSLDLRGETGSFYLGSIGGDLSAQTTSGSITVANVGGRANLRSTTGNIFTGVLGGPSRVTTSNGAVEVLQARDALSVRGRDSDILLGVANPLPPGIDLATSAGSITLGIDRDVPLVVDASTGLLGRVRARGLEPELRRGAFDSSSVVAGLNGGGELVRVRTKWGNVTLVGRYPLDQS